MHTNVMCVRRTYTPNASADFPPKHENFVNSIEVDGGASLVSLSLIFLQKFVFNFFFSILFCWLCAIAATIVVAVHLPGPKMFPMVISQGYFLFSEAQRSGKKSLKLI